MGRAWRWGLSFPFWLWLGFCVLAPVFVLAKMSVALRGPYGQILPGFTLEHYRTLMDPLYLEVLGRTGLLAVATTLASLILAYPVAFFLSRLESHKRSLWICLILIPFWTSFLIRVLSFMDFLRWDFWHDWWIYKAQGVWLAMVYSYLPMAFLPIFSNLEKIPNDLIEAARDLGASKSQVFTKVLWPLSKPGVKNAFLFVLIPSLGEYLIPTFVGGGNTFVLGNFLHNQYLTARHWPLGSAAIIILVGLTCLALAYTQFGPKPILREQQR